MNTAVVSTLSAYPQPAPPGTSLWSRQILSISKATIAKTLFSKRVFGLISLISLPIIFLGIVGYIPHNDGGPFLRNLGNARFIFGLVYSTFILGAVLFLGSATLFTAIIRGEILDRSIHFVLLAPVRREVIVLGRFLGGMVAAFILFGTTTLICYLLIYQPFGLNRLIIDLSGGIAVQQIAVYLLMTLLGCLGYGSVFMATSVVFRNPLLPILVIAGWEFINFILPPALKIISVVYYLKNLMPVMISDTALPLAVVSSPLPAFLSIAGIVAITAISLTISAFFMRRMEINYAKE